jgi:uncharacterized protein (DUF1697 family)
VTTFVALLRAVNVGGKNRLPMAELRAALDAGGMGQVATVLQSGNVLLHSTESEASVAARVAEIIERTFGLRVGVVARSSGDLVTIAARNPFLTNTDDLDPATLHVAFLADHPTKAAVATLDPERSPPDAFAIDGREVFIHYPNGSGRSRLTLSYIERALGVKGTARNWRTVERLTTLVEHE